MRGDEQNARGHARAVDRFTLTGRFQELEFTDTDVGYSANLFYSIRGGAILTTNIVTTFTTNTVITFTTNNVTTFTTNSVVTFTPTNTVSATGSDICQARTVSAAVNCRGPIDQAAHAGVIGSPTLTDGLWSLSFPTENGKAYTLQYKNRFDDSVWIDLGTVAGTGATLSLMVTTGVQPPTRFYRVISTPY